MLGRKRPALNSARGSAGVLRLSLAKRLTGLAPRGLAMWRDAHNYPLMRHDVRAR
jgi:hypothetical protein